MLTVAGSDSGGGAGIQADIKAITRAGGFPLVAVTALTAQTTTGVHGVVGTPPAFVRDQIRLVAADIGLDAVKTGMLGTPETVAAVAAELADLDAGRRDPRRRRPGDAGRGRLVAARARRRRRVPARCCWPAPP